MLISSFFFNYTPSKYQIYLAAVTINFPLSRIAYYFLLFIRCFSHKKRRLKMKLKQREINDILLKLHHHHNAVPFFQLFLGWKVWSIIPWSILMYAKCSINEISQLCSSFRPWSENSTHENSTHENSTHENSTHENSTQRKFHPAKIRLG